MQLRFLILIFLFTTISASAWEVPEDAQPLPDLKLDSGEAFVRENSIYLRLRQLPANGKLNIPRLANVLERIQWVGDDSGATMTMWPEIHYWELRLHRKPPQPSAMVLELILDGPPVLFDRDPIAIPNRQGVLSLPAKFARTFGEKLRFEGQPHKNTVGYWTIAEDYATWQLQPATGEFDVEIYQGCGKGHGGSLVQIQIGDQELNFEVEETGHFQNFRWRHLGRIRLSGSQQTQLKLVPMVKVGGAVMDCREIRLVPARKPQLRMAGRNIDGTRADGRDVQSDQPNVLIVLTDDQGTLDAGCYGSRDLFTPRIDGLANSGIRFTQAYSHTVCCPARAMLMTGRHPQRSGVTSWTQGDLRAKRGINMATEEITIAEALKGSGYRTGLTGKWHLGAAADAGPTTQGFDYFFGHRGGFIDNFNHFFLHGNGFHDLYHGTQEVFHRGEYFPDLTVQKATEFLTDHLARHPEMPFFLYSAFNIPHYPEQGDSKFDQYYCRTPMPRQSYGRMMTTVDDRIGRVLNHLDRLGVRENTIVVFQSDNGHSEETNHIRVDNHSSGLPKGHKYGANGGGGNTGKWRGRKGTYYEGGLRVPAIISWPHKLPTKLVRDQAITLCDWMPTVLDLCKIKLPNLPLDGKSLLPIIRGNAESHHKVLHWQWQNRWAVRQGDWKLIGSPRGKPELVNLADPEPERTNHAKEQPAVVERLEKLHREWIESVTRNP